jgi:hypothetical protein
MVWKLQKLFILKAFPCCLGQSRSGQIPKLVECENWVWFVCSVCPGLFVLRFFFVRSLSTEEQTPKSSRV